MKIIIDGISEYNAFLLRKLSKEIVGEKIEIECDYYDYDRIKKFIDIEDKKVNKYKKIGIIK